MGRNWRITTISSSDTGDIGDVPIEGHTISGTGVDSVFTFSTQNAILAGQTQVTLTTPLARTSRMYNNNGTDFVGDVYIYEDDTDTAGVPDTDTKVHLMIPAGHNQTQKASTTMSNVDYWIITGFYIDLLERAVGYCNAEMQIRLPGKVFRERVSISATSSGRGFHNFNPYYICPKNSDIRVRAIADKINTEVSGGIDGFLAQVVGAAVN